MKDRHLVMFAGTALVLLVVAGCGSSSSGSSSTASRFVSQGNQICRKYNAQLNPLGDKALAAARSGDLQSAADQVDKEVQIATSEVHDLARLHGSPGQEHKRDQGVAKVRKLIDSARQLSSALRRGDRADASRLLDQANSYDAQGGSLLEAVGLDDCNNSSTGSSTT